MRSRDSFHEFQVECLSVLLASLLALKLLFSIHCIFPYVRMCIPATRRNLFDRYSPKNIIKDFYSFDAQSFYLIAMENFFLVITKQINIYSEIERIYANICRK